MVRLLAVALLTLPAVPLAAAAASALRPTAARRLARGATALTAVLATGAALAISLADRSEAGVTSALVAIDPLTALMIVLISGLAWVITRYAATALEGDPAEARYHGWSCATVAAVLAMVVAGNLLLLVIAWVTTSLGLHQLLTLYRGRAGAQFAARKKFVVSWLGNACLITALILIGRTFGTWNFSSLFAHITAPVTGAASAAAVLLAVGAALKSAQVPFHSWLPDTMETPTPVSAFMHAGLVNAGGFLMIRLAPLIGASSAALATLVVFGTVTAAVGSLVMLTQPSVKRALAYSTVAQMGFMLLECGLGQFGLAQLHLVAHSVYKAHAFLTAGSTVGAAPRAAIPLRSGFVALGAAVAAVALALSDRSFGFGAGGAELLMVGIAGLALTYALGRMWSAWNSPRAILAGIAGAGLFAALIGVAHHGLVPAPHGAIEPSPALTAFVAVTFAGLFLVQINIWRLHRFTWGRALYVHAVNGFYLPTLANRWLRRLWPHVPVSVG